MPKRGYRQTDKHKAQAKKWWAKQPKNIEGNGRFYRIIIRPCQKCGKIMDGNVLKKFCYFCTLERKRSYNRLRGQKLRS